MRKIREAARWKRPGHHPWTAQEVTLLQLMTPHFTYPEIALRLGRSLTAVQHKASYLGLSQRAERSEQAEDTREYRKSLEEAFLRLSEADLSDYLPECDEEPARPHHGSRTYYKEVEARKRARKESA